MSKGKWGKALVQGGLLALGIWLLWQMGLSLLTVKAVLPENAAQSGAEDALACVGHRALDHNVFRHGQTSRRARMSASFSARVRTAMRYQPGQSPA